MNDKLKMTKDTKPWYEKGLSFNCTGCGKCCSGASGYVWVDEQEILDIANFLKLSDTEFRSKYVIQVGDKFSLKELKKTDYQCIFLRDKQCTIYEARPRQCRTYPFWPSIMRSKKNWDEEANACEGIRNCSSIVEKNEIETKLKIMVDAKNGFDNLNDF